MQIVTISSKYQITIPKALLASLDLQPKKKLVLRTDQGKLLGEPLRGTMTEEVAGSLTKYVSPDKLGKPYATILAETKKKTAGQLVRHL